MNLSYVIVLVLGAKALLESREQGLSTFQSGDFVFQLSPGQNLPDVLQRLNFFRCSFSEPELFCLLLHWLRKVFSSFGHLGSKLADTWSKPS